MTSQLSDFPNFLWHVIDGGVVWCVTVQKCQSPKNQNSDIRKVIESLFTEFGEDSPIYFSNFPSLDEQAFRFQKLSCAFRRVLGGGAPVPPPPLQHLYDVQRPHAFSSLVAWIICIHTLHRAMCISHAFCNI